MFQPTPLTLPTLPTLPTLSTLIARLKPLHHLSSVILAAGLSLTMITPSHARERIRWTPDADRGSIDSTLSGGQRGQAVTSCNVSDNATRLALMVPGDRSRLLTTHTTPTLTWHVSTIAPVTVTFHFSDPTVATPIYTQVISIDHTATIGMTLPKENSLDAEKRYRWTVFVSCPDNAQTEISAHSFIEHVERESLNVNNLSNLEQASAYANQGIWYDAIAALLAAGSQGINDAEIMVQSLLEQGHSQAEITLSAVVNL